METNLLECYLSSFEFICPFGFNLPCHGHGYLLITTTITHEKQIRGNVEANYTVSQKNFLLCLAKALQSGNFFFGTLCIKVD